MSNTTTTPLMPAVSIPSNNPVFEHFTDADKLDLMFVAFEDLINKLTEAGLMAPAIKLN